ncbi:uncharacterized protein LOC108594498 [Drosophila busckii]|uniref:uncharacterized protein LOC108594498 n=1 Tax=Drosophila busckii TaxID=30019 RepID=UPI001433305C|nr:uncharacterized protein LOC108594498 [Drosophila busckii]
MSTTLGVMLLSFSFVTANFSALKSCCAPESTLFKIRDTNGTENFKCANTISDQNDDIVDQTERVLGFGIVEQEQPQFPQCTRTTYLNISRSGEESMSLPTNSCILGLSDRLIVMKCENNNNSEQFQNIGFINKCCPHGYSYITELNKCSLRDPDFSVFINIFDKPMIFVDNSFGCAKNQVLIEYEITANDIRWKNNQLVWKDGTKSFKRNEFCLETIIANSNVEQSHQFLIRSCQKNAICRSLACIRKCCGDGEFYAKGNRTTLCKRENNEHNFQSSSTLNISGNFTKPSEFGVLSGLDCPKFRLDPDSYSDESHIISSTNGSLFIASTNKVYSNGQYCIEKIKNSSFVDQKNSCTRFCALILKSWATIALGSRCIRLVC